MQNKGKLPHYLRPKQEPKAVQKRRRQAFVWMLKLFLSCVSTGAVKIDQKKFPFFLSFLFFLLLLFCIVNFYDYIRYLCTELEESFLTRCVTDWCTLAAERSEIGTRILWKATTFVGTLLKLGTHGSNGLLTKDQTNVEATYWWCSI